MSERTKFTASPKTKAEDSTKTVFFLGGARRNSYQKPPPSASGVAEVTPIQSAPNDVYQDLVRGASGCELPTYEGLRQRSGEDCGSTGKSGINEQEREEPMPRVVADDLYVNTTIGAW